MRWLAALLLAFPLYGAAQITLESPVAAAFNRPLNTAAAVSPFGWYKLDDASGATATDSSGNGFHGTITGTTLWDPAGHIGGALRLTNFVSTTLTTDNTTGAGLTVAFWLKNNTTSTSAQNLVSKFGAGSVQLQYQFGNRLNLTIDGATDLTARTSTSFGALATNTWVHIAFTWDGTTNATGVIFYRNGSAISKDTTINGAAIVSGSALAWTFGGMTDAVYDEILFYNAALSAAEIAALAAM